MAQNRPRIALCGLGSIGKAVARLLIDHRQGFELVGAATQEPEAIGQPLGAVAGSAEPIGPIVVGDIDALLETNPDIVVFATGSFLRDTGDDIVKLARAGVDLVSPCEELAFPFRRFAADAKRVKEAALAGGATVLGTGVNPGFMFDALVSLATCVSWDVSAIRGQRIVDVAGFGENIHLRLGIGYTAQEFDDGHEQGTIAGHVGFPESIQIIAERIGLTLDGPVDETFEKMIADTPAPTRYGQVDVGKTEGFRQRAVGRVNGEERIVLDLVLHLRPEEAGMHPADSFQIDGIHPVRLTLDPGMDAIPATAAQLVNSIPTVLEAGPGLKTVTDLPAAAAWLADPSTNSTR